LVVEDGEKPVYSIGAVARMLEIPTSTLRAWEERYALIKPLRSSGSQRLYSRAQVERLRYLKSQIESGVSAADAHRLLSEELTAGHVPHVGGEAPAEGKPLVLIAEKDSYAAELAEYFLRTEGWDVAIALDAVQARLHFQERSPDIVVLDLLISGGAGFRLLGEFAAQRKAPVIAVSALDSADEALKLGAAAFIAKPLEALVLVSTVRDMLGRSALVGVKRKVRR
jgi:DNA-binding transcriptional MerR regulator